MRRVARGVAVALAAAAVVAGLVSCGGSDSSSDVGSKDYDPAETTLHDAGLEACSEEGRLVSAHVPGLPGLTASRGFYVAADCNGATVTPNAVVVAQFNSSASTKAAAPKVKAAYPKGDTMIYGPLVIVTTGPKKTSNLDAINTELQKRPLPTSTT